MPRLIVISNRLPSSIKPGADVRVYEYVPSSGAYTANFNVQVLEGRKLSR